MAVDDRARDAGLAGHRLDRDRVEAAPRDDRLGGVEQLLATLRGMHPHRGHRAMLHRRRLRVCNSHGQLRRRHRDHRQRVLGPRHGDPPQAGGDRRLHRARARRRCRRDLALQHLSGLRLRRALASVLVLLRAQPGVERDLLQPARDPRLPAALRRRVRRARARAAQLRGRGHRVGRGRRRLDARDRPRAAARARRGGRHGPARRAEVPAGRGARRLRGRDVPLRALEPRLRPAGQARGRGRHRRLGDPVRARDPERRRAAARDPAHAAVDHAAPEPLDPRLGARASTTASRCCRSSSAAPPTALASCSCSASSRTRGS